MVPSTKQLWDFWISPKTISVKNTSLDFRSLTKCYIMCIYRDINWGEVKGHSLKQHVSKINRLLVLLTIRKWLNINRLVSDITEQIIEDPLINMWRYKKKPCGNKRSLCGQYARANNLKSFLAAGCICMCMTHTKTSSLQIFYEQYIQFNASVWPQEYTQ